jgi:hypothetical protein
MKKIVLFVSAILCAIQLSAQSVDVDKKTGMVTVDDKEAFYLEPKSVGMMTYDFSLQNLQHKELAYLKHQEVPKMKRDGTTTTVTEYLMVFTKTGNLCTITGLSMITGYMKPMAKMIASANIIQNGEVSPTEERKFITLNNGTFVSNTSLQPEKVVVTNTPSSTPRNTGPADISLKEPNIYNNSEMVGVYKRTEDAGVTTISVYNNNDALVCKATHPNDNPDADWMIVTDGKTASILYNSAAPLEKLFKYLVEKGIL